MRGRLRRAPRTPQGAAAWNSVGGAALSMVLAALSGPLLAEEPPVTIATSVDRSEVAVCESLRYTITVEHPETIRVRAPDVGSLPGGYSVNDSGREPTGRAEGRMVEAWWYALSMDTPGAQEIPAPVVTYEAPDGVEQTARGSPVTITVTSVLPDDWEAQDIRDIKPPVGLARVPWSALSGLLALLAGLLAAWRWLNRHKPAASKPSTPPKPPHQIAMEDLERLWRDGLPARGRYEEYYVRLSRIVRWYVEGRFGVRAPEMTTEEFLRAASEAQPLSAGHRQLLREFLLRCDLVKFARHQPSVREADDAFSSAQRMVEETKPVEQPVEPSGANARA